MKKSRSPKKTNFELIIVAAKSKERTDAVETERVEKDRGLEIAERERVVTLADIDKEKAIEVEKKNIQDVIRERVMVERAVVEEEEKIKDTREFAAADRKKQVAVTAAEEMAQQQLVKEVKAADAEKQAADLQAETIVVTAEAEPNSRRKRNGRQENAGRSDSSRNRRHRIGGSPSHARKSRSRWKKKERPKPKSSS